MHIQYKLRTLHLQETCLYDRLRIYRRTAQGLSLIHISSGGVQGGGVSGGAAADDDHIVDFFHGRLLTEKAFPE